MRNIFPTPILTQFPPSNQAASRRQPACRRCQNRGTGLTKRCFRSRVLYLDGMGKQKNFQSQLIIKVPEIFYTNTTGGGTKCKIIVGKKTIAYRQKMQPIEQSYNREGKGLRGHNSQRDLDTGGTPAAAVELALRVWYNRIKGKCGRGRIAGGVCQSRPCGME